MRKQRGGPPGVGARPAGVEIGDLLGPVGVVDAKGTLVLDGEPWRVEWAVGAEDRWHVAVDEVAVRQDLLDDTPVTVTAMKVPGGDVVHRVAGISDGSGRAVSIEVENETGAPVSVALAVRPAGSDGIRTVAIEGERLLVDDREVILVDRSPGGTVAAETDVIWSSVMAGPGRGDASATSLGGTASGAVIVPIPHHQAVRVLVPVEGPMPESAASSTIAAGWRVIADRAASIDVGRSDAITNLRRAVPSLVLSAGSADLERAAAVAPLLDRLGLPDEADRARATLVVAMDQGRVKGRLAAATAVAFASRRLWAGRESGLVDLVAVLVGSAGGGLSGDDVEFIADALEREDDRAAADVRRLAPGSAGRPPDAADVQTLIDAVLSESVAGLDLLPRPERSWLGHPIDVRGLSTRHGVVSYSIRWHDDRPALLWEVETDELVGVSCTGLDTTWSSTGSRGEALLSATELPAARSTGVVLDPGDGGTIT